MFLDILALALTAALRVFGLYFFVVALFCLKRPSDYMQRPPQTRFACLIAARNEEMVIGKMVESLQKQEYPQELYDIYVIPNHCSDRTEEQARLAGAHILHCSQSVRCKGDVLHEAVARLMGENYDAFCVFDADNVVDGQFLKKMNDAFSDGAEVAKGTLRVKNPSDSWVSGCYGLYFTMFDTFYSRARANCGLSAKLVGTGFAVSRQVLELLGGWNTVTIAEDAEFSAQCASHGIRIFYVPGAVTYDEAPPDLRTSLRQRRRWCSGVMSVAECRMGKLCRALRGRGGFRAFDMMVFLSGPFVQAFSLLPLLLCGVCAVLNGELRELGLSLLLGLAAGWIGCTGMAAVLARVGGYGTRVWKGVFLFPLFMATWLPLQVVSLIWRTRQWKTISHTRSLSVGELTGEKAR